MNIKEASMSAMKTLFILRIERASKRKTFTVYIARPTTMKFEQKIP
jgi:hypothetical protein